MSTQISVVIITFNEEKNIERCLQSIENIADEIIVLDSFSTDKTEEICKKFNVKFHQHKFDGHIQQKNRAMDLAENDYVLSLDADEAPDETLINEIKHIKENTNSDAYYFNRLTYYCGKWIKHCGWYPDRKLRIWNKNKGKWGGVNPHDKVIMQEGTSKKHIKGDLLHYSFYTINQHLAQINYFSEIKANEAFKRKKINNIFTILFKPSIRFFIMYIIKAGFLDGYYGYVVCKNSAFSEHLKQTKLRELYKNARK